MHAMVEMTRNRNAQIVASAEPGIWHGVSAMLALTPGVVVFAVAFAVSALAAGFTPIEVVALSALIFAGSAQLSIVALAGAGANPLVIVATAVALNLRHIMYGLSLSRQLGTLPIRRRLPVAFLLTDETFGITIREYTHGRAAPLVALGAGIGLYAIYVTSTVLGVVAGEAIPLPDAIDLGFVFPLMFLALLAPLIQDRERLAMAITAGLLAIAFGSLLPGGVSILLVMLVTSFGWAMLPSRQTRGAAR